MPNWWESNPTFLALLLHLGKSSLAAILTDSLSVCWRTQLCRSCCQAPGKIVPTGTFWSTHGLLSGKNQTSLQINSFSSSFYLVVYCPHTYGGTKQVNRFRVYWIYWWLFVGKVHGVASKKFGGTFAWIWIVMDGLTDEKSEHTGLFPLCTVQTWLNPTQIYLPPHL